MIRMKVAIYEPYPRVAGPVEWSRHLREGFRALGHECDIVTITRSGRLSARWGEGTAQVNRGWSWSTVVPDQVAKGSDAGEFFDGYDFIILTEPKSSPFDRDTLKRRGQRGVFKERYPDQVQPDMMPKYIEWLGATRTRWTTALHGPQYQPMRAPFLRDLLSLDNFTGHLMTRDASFTNLDSDPTGTLASVIAHEHWPLPFVARIPIDAPFPTRRVFGMLGRVTTNKGPQLLAHAADDLPAGWDVEIHGAGGIGSGPAFTYRLYRTLKARGFVGDIEGGEFDAVTGRARALKCERWQLTSPGGRSVAYLGHYEDPYAIASRFAVHVDLTDRWFSYGNMAEFVCLEAADVGCVLLYPRHIIGEAPYECIVLEHFTTPPPIRTPKNETRVDILHLDALEPDVYPEFVARARDAAYAAEDPRRRDVVAYNRQVLRECHDPKILAQRFIEECR